MKIISNSNLKHTSVDWKLDDLLYLTAECILWTLRQSWAILFQLDRWLVFGTTCVAVAVTFITPNAGNCIEERKRKFKSLSRFYCAFSLFLSNFHNYMIDNFPLFPKMSFRFAKKLLWNLLFKQKINFEENISKPWPEYKKKLKWL